MGPGRVHPRVRGCGHRRRRLAVAGAGGRSAGGTRDQQSARGRHSRGQQGWRLPRGHGRRHSRTPQQRTALVQRIWRGRSSTVHTSQRQARSSHRCCRESAGGVMAGPGDRARKQARHNCTRVRERQRPTHDPVLSLLPLANSTRSQPLPNCDQHPHVEMWCCRTPPDFDPADIPTHRERARRRYTASFSP